MFVIGIDPGPTPGVVRLELADRHPSALFGADALQCSPGVLTTILRELSRDEFTVLAVENFVVGPRAARSATPGAGALTRELVAALRTWAFEQDLPFFLATAAGVKPWATDDRLAATGVLLPLTTGMRHARDAGRHALFRAVKTYGLPDPLSAKAGVL